MKKILQLLAYPMAVLLILSSCKKDENKVYLEGGKAPVLTTSTNDVILAPGTESQPGIAFSWTNPDYMFTTGVSSQDVTYNLEIDTLGADFKSGNKYVTSISKALGVSYTKGELNSILGNNMQVPTGKQYTLQARVISSLGSTQAAKLTSETVSFKANPFTPPPAVEPPTTGELFLIGNGTPGGDATGWDNPVPVPTQKFTKISNTKYEITIDLIGGKSLLFIPKNGDWGDKYGWAGGNNENPVQGSIDLRRGGGDIKTPPSSAKYKIVVDFQIGKFTITKI